MDKSSLIYPMFVKEGTGIKEEIPTMPGQYRYSIDQLPYALEELVKVGVGSVMFLVFPITRMLAEAALTMKMASCRRRSGKRRSSSRIYTALATSACASTHPMATAVFSMANM